MSKRLINFSAGPAALPESVLQKAQAELLNYHNKGLSVLEMSHRSKPFEEILATTEARLRQLLNIPENYAVLFLQGGASLQFSMIPMNLVGPDQQVAMIHTGIWSGKAIDELKKGIPHTIIASGEPTQFRQIPMVTPDMIPINSAYVHIVSNNTVYGTQIQTFPDTGNIPLIADMSSDIMSRPIDVSKFGLIFAGAQKNLGPSGVTLVIIRKDLAERAPTSLPTMLQYRTHIKANSLYNTPPTYSIYILGLMLEWVDSQGGISAMQALTEKKSCKLYQYIDQSQFYSCPNVVDSRSQMNVVFRIQNQNEDLEKKFITESTQAGLLELKGHRSAGGLRASIYNGVTETAVDALITFMEEFKKNNA